VWSPFDCELPDYRGHGGRPTVHVVPVGSVTGDVGVVVPVNDVVEPLPADGLTAVAALVIAPGVFVDTPGPVTPSDVVMFVEPSGVVIEELPDPGEDVLLLGVDVLELIDDERDDVGAVCVNSNEIPLLPSTDPVWTLAIGLQGIDVVLVKPGVWLGGVSEVGLGGTCATAIDVHAMLIQMNKGSFISNLLYRSAVRFTGGSCASRQPHGCVREGFSRASGTRTCGNEAQVAVRGLIAKLTCDPQLSSTTPLYAAFATRLYGRRDRLAIETAEFRHRGEQRPTHDGPKPGCQGLASASITSRRPGDARGGRRRSRSS
jgi:hypothetical protein